MHAFVLAGGLGTRLAPMSTCARPKPYLHLFDEGATLLQQTLMRVAGLPGLRAAGVIGSRRHAALLSGQLSGAAEVPDVRWLVLEPSARSTGPAIVFTALLIARHLPEMPLLFLPADHVHARWPAFVRGLEEALAHVRRHDHICLFGMPVRGEDPGVGYLCLGEEGEAGGRPDGSGEAGAIRRVRRFVEKPDPGRLSRLLERERVRINAGMVLGRAGVIAETAARVAPELHAACARALERTATAMDGRVLPDAAAWAACPEIAFDRAVLERAENVVCLPCDTGWRDVGTWPSVWAAVGEIAAEGGAAAAWPWRVGENGAVSRGAAALSDVAGSLVWACGGARVTVRGVRNLAVLANGRDVLVQPLEERPAADRRPLWLPAPWGAQMVLHRDEEAGLQVKLLRLRPGARTSLQRHRHRSERLCAIAGQVRLHVDGRVCELRPGMDRTVPSLALHRLENPGRGTALVLEVQRGDYLGDDDIIRYDDDYGRC